MTRIGNMTEAQPQALLDIGGRSELLPSDGGAFPCLVSVEDSEYPVTLN
jgi:hypothetical protein